jgi:hypothetical protein
MTMQIKGRNTSVWLWVIVASAMMVLGTYLSVHDAMRDAIQSSKARSQTRLMDLRAEQARIYDPRTDEKYGAALVAFSSLLFLLAGVATNRQVISVGALGICVVLYEALFWPYLIIAGPVPKAYALSQVRPFTEWGLFFLFFANPWSPLILFASLAIALFIFAVSTPWRRRTAWPQRFVVLGALVVFLLCTIELSRLVRTLSSIGPVH